MNVTFLIGNGFDVGLGLKTSFSDYYPIYIAKSKLEKNYYGELAEEIFKDIDKWSDFEKAMGEYTEKFSLDNKENYYKQIEDFEIKFINYLKDLTDGILFDERKIVPVFKKALTDFYKENQLHVASSRQIANVLQNSVAENLYYNFISFNYTDALDKCLNVLTKEDKNLTTRKIHGNTYCNTIGEIVHVHGETNRNAIFGVADVKQLANKDFHSEYDQKRLVKPKINKQLKNENDVRADRLIGSSKIICVYGMSLGITDENWWKKIVDWLRGLGDRQLIIFDYDKDFDESLTLRWIDKEEKLQNKILSYSSEISDDVKESLKNRIHIAVHKNIFELELENIERQMEESA